MERKITSLHDLFKIHNYRLTDNKTFSEMGNIQFYSDYRHEYPGITINSGGIALNNGKIIGTVPLTKKLDESRHLIISFIFGNGT